MTLETITLLFKTRQEDGSPVLFFREVTMEKNKRVYFLATLYALIIGFSFLFTKIALRYADPIDILAYRFTASFIAILIPVLFKKISLNYGKEEIKRIIPLALFQPLLYFGFQTFGLRYASSTEAAIIQASSPIFILILATLLLKEQTNIYQKLFTILSVAGVIYIVIMTDSSFDSASLKGIILLLLGALSFSAYNIMARVLTKDFSSIELSYIMNIVGFICFGIIAIIKNLMSGSMRNFFYLSTEFSFIIAIVYLGVMASLFTSLLNNYVLSKMEASKMSVFGNLRTVISIIAGVVFLKEEIFFYHIIGSILIIVGVMGTNFLDDMGIEKIRTKLEKI